MAEPRFAHVSHRVSHTNGRGRGKNYQAKRGKPFKEEQILLRIPRRAGVAFFTALVPHKAGDPAPKFETALEGKAIRLTFADGRIDTVALMLESTEIEAEGRKLTGTAFVVTRTPEGRVRVTGMGQ